MDPDNSTDPRRGGNDGNLGIFLGGAQLDDTYMLKTDCEPYQCALQLHNSKALLTIESDLRKMAVGSGTARFNGTLTLKDSDNSSTELDKEGFLLAVDEAVCSYGFHSFFCLPDTNNVMRYLPEYSHIFTVSSALKEHRERMIEPSKIIDNN